LAPPQNVTVEVVSSQSIYISWESPSITEQNGKIVSYDIQVEDLHENNVTDRNVPDRNITIEEVPDRNVTIEGTNILVIILLMCDSLYFQRKLETYQTCCNLKVVSLQPPLK